MRTRPRVVLGAAMLLILSGAGVLALAADAWATGTLTVAPSTDLSGGQVVAVSGSGFTASSEGTIIECSNAPSQPTIDVAGNPVPVSCTDPLSVLTGTNSAGVLPSKNFHVVEGTVGPPTTGTDSAGNDAATDAATYPCPPTSAQAIAGDSCYIAFGDQAGDEVMQNITFSTTPATTTTTTTSSTTTTTTTTTAPSSTTTTTVPCNAKATTSTGSPSLTATPGTCLNGGTTVTVTGSGFDHSSPGTVLECNNASGQPTVALPAPVSQSVAVSCSGISASALITTTGTGTLSTTFSILSPTSGPPCGSAYLVSCPATDSAGISPSTDAANYPCPPTAAQIAAGASCTLSFGDAGGAQGTVAISFVPAPTASGGSQSSSSSHSSSTGSGSSTTATTVPATNAGTLAFTGTGPATWVLAIGGFLLIDLGFLVLTLYYRPSEMLTLTGRRVNRILGGDS